VGLRWSYIEGLLADGSCWIGSPWEIEGCLYRGNRGRRRRALRLGTYSLTEPWVAWLDDGQEDAILLEIAWVCFWWKGRHLHVMRVI
jgi:hypothetical protein